MESIDTILGKDNVKYNEPMSKHTTFKVGGNADIFAYVNSIKKLKLLLNSFEVQSEKMPITVIGNGSNIIVKDNGIRGLVIKYIANDINLIHEEDKVFAQIESGALNAQVARKMLEEEISGFEFAAGIPGTIGGAIVMNAGAFGSEIKDILVETTYINLKTQEIRTIKNSEHKFEYRSSIFEDMNDVIILSAKFKFTKGNKYEIQSKMNEYMEKRLTTQPLDFPSAGSTFKRGNNYITAKLIDDAGLKGFSIGGAKISEKHTGFIVNYNYATAKDIIDLIEYVKNQINIKYGINIETEVRILGE